MTIREQNKYELFNFFQRNEYRLSKFKSTKLNIIYRKFEINLAHDKILLEGINYIEQMSNINKVKDENGTWYAKQLDFDKELLVVKPLQTLSSAIETFIINLIIIATIILTIFLIIIFIISVCKIANKIKRNKLRKIKFNTLNERIDIELANNNDAKALISELNQNELFQKANTDMKASILSLISQ